MSTLDEERSEVLLGVLNDAASGAADPAWARARALLLDHLLRPAAAPRMGYPIPRDFHELRQHLRPVS